MKRLVNGKFFADVSEVKKKKKNAGGLEQHQH
jgi:hypothetical protein